MKSMYVLKTLPYLAIAILAVGRGLMAFFDKNRKGAGRSTAAEHPDLKGVVNKVLKDGHTAFVLISDGPDRYWVTTTAEPPSIGQNVTCKVRGFIEAHESKTLSMAFEKVYVADGIFEGG